MLVNLLKSGHLHIPLFLALGTKTLRNKLTIGVIEESYAVAMLVAVDLGLYGVSIAQQQLCIALVVGLLEGVPHHRQHSRRNVRNDNHLKKKYFTGEHFLVY